MNPSTDSIEQTLGLRQTAGRPVKKYLFILLLTALVGAVGVYVWNHFTSKQKTEYLTAPLEIKDLTTTVSATGNLEPTNTVDVGIEVSGTISDVLVDYNDRVKVGQVMARLDTTKLASKVTSYQAALSKYRANIAEAKAQLKNAQHESDRVHQMYTATGGNYPSKKEVDEASIAVEQAKAQVAAAIAQSEQSTAELKTAQEDLRKAVVISPVDGIVLERKVEPGQTVVASMQTPVLFTMAEDLTKMKVLVSVDEADIGEVKEGQKAEFSVDAYPNTKFNGVITQLRLNSQIVNGVVTYDAVVEVENDKLLLRPGMTASAQIITGVMKNALTLPNSALRFTPKTLQKEEGKKAKENTQNGNEKEIWVLRNGTPVKVKITILKTDGTETAVESDALSRDDQVIVGMKESE